MGGYGVRNTFGDCTGFVLNYIRLFVSLLFVSFFDLVLCWCIPFVLVCLSVCAWLSVCVCVCMQVHMHV